MRSKIEAISIALDKALSRMGSYANHNISDMKVACDVMLSNEDLKYKCEYCGKEDGVEMYCSHTMYSWDGNGKDPNRSLVLCKECGGFHEEYWADMWADYYHSVMY